MKIKKDDELKILNEEELDAVQVEETEAAEEEPVVEKVEAVVVTTGTVIANMLNIRALPTMDSFPIGTLCKGNTIQYTVENDEWLKLEGRSGYVKREFIQ